MLIFLIHTNLMTRDYDLYIANTLKVPCKMPGISIDDLAYE